MTWQSFWMDLRLKVRQNRWLFFICFFFWLSGFIFFVFVNPDENINTIVLIAFKLREPTNSGIYGDLYLFLWPTFVETMIFGFLVNAIIQKYNPIITSRMLAQHQSNHTIVIGYQHIGRRMVEFLQEKHRPYVLIDIDEKIVSDLLEDAQPVVIGSGADTDTLRNANVKKAKEVFILINRLRETIVIAEKVRAMNRKCKINVRLFEEGFQDYFEAPPLRAYTFSSSRWALESIKNWTEGFESGAIVIGHDHLAEKATNYIAHERKRPVWIMDEHLDEDFFPNRENLTIIQNSIDRLESITRFVDLTKISQIFICWKEEAESNEAVHIAQLLKLSQPHLKIYVRIFDEELANILNRIGATTFSSSSFVFKRLQSEVKPDSGISLRQK